MSTATRLPEKCRVYLDNTLLPERVNGTGLPVPLSPFTIEWGVSAPWDAAVPAVLKITFIDPDGDYSRVYTTLAGHRITIAPDWTENGIDNGPNPVKYCMFDGIITDVQILANDAGHDRLSITASDRIYVLRNDCRKGPNWNQHEEMVRGFQWWPKGNIGPQIKAWLANDGINNYWLPWSTFLAGIKADQKSSLLDWLESVKTRQINGTYTLEINRSVFMSYKGQPSTVPSLEAVYLNWDVETVLAGARIITGDDGTDITRDHRYADAENVLIDENPTLTAPDSYYTQLELRYSHLKLASSSSGQLYEVSQDGSLVKQIETATYEGENCLSVTVNWADSGASQNNINVLDTTRAENYLKTQNQRVRLPQITFRGDLFSQMFLYCNPRVITIIGSRFERTVPATHGPWAVIGGTLTYDATNKRSRWAHKIRLFPAQDTTSQGKPTCAELKKLTAATFGQCNWKLGALRYVTKIKETT